MASALHGYNLLEMPIASRPVHALVPSKQCCADSCLLPAAQSRYKVRVVSARAYHCLFMHNMLIRPTEAELASFGRPDFTIFNAGAFPCNRYTSYMTSSSSVDVNLKVRWLPVSAGEIKSAVQVNAIECNSSLFSSAAEERHVTMLQT